MANESLATRVRTAFGLAFDVQRTSATASGFEPALVDLGAHKQLFGQLRLEGFAALLRIGFADEPILVGGNEGRYKDERPVVNRAESIRLMLIHDLGCDPARIHAFPTNSNTGGNIGIVRRIVDERSLKFDDFGLVTSHYHVPRAHRMLVEAGVVAQLFSAEAFPLVERDGRKDALVRLLGGGPLAERDGVEIQGFADLIRGTYKPLTDTPAT